MNRAKLNYIIDIIMIIIFVMSAITGFALYVIPGGIYRGGLTVFLGIEKHMWGNIHTVSSFILVALVGIHLILHWNWIVCMTKSFMKKKEKKCETPITE